MDIKAISLSVLIGIAIGWVVNGWKWQSKYDSYVAEQHRQSALVQERILQKERQWQLEFEKIEEKYEEEKAVLATNLANAVDARDGMLSEIGNLQRRIKSNPSATQQCESWRDSALLLSELLRESDRAAEGYAAEADRVTVVAQLCEQHYNTLRNK